MKRTRGIAVAACLLIAAVMFAGYRIYSYDQGSFRVLDNAIADTSDFIPVVRSEYERALSSEATRITVYDANSVELFSIISGDEIIAVSHVPDVLQEAILAKKMGGCAPSHFLFSEWKKSITWLGSLRYDIDLVREMQCYAPALVVQDIMNGEGVDLSVVELAVLSQELAGESLDDCVRFFASTGQFGEVKGAEAAAEYYFGCKLGELNEPQLRYLGYAFDNPNANFLSFAEEFPQYTGGATEQTSFGVGGDLGTAYWEIRSQVVDELLKIFDGELPATELRVQTSINVGLQREMQASLDRGMYFSVDLTANGSPVLNGSAVIVDPKTGLISAFVGCRSTVDFGKVFRARDVQIVEDLKALKTYIAGNPSVAPHTLLECTSAHSDTMYRTLRDLFLRSNLSAVGIAVGAPSSVSALDVADYMTGLYVDSTPRLVAQVCNTSGEVLYTASPLLDRSGFYLNADIRLAMCGDVHATSCVFSRDEENSVVSVSLCSEFLLCAVLGADAEGYTLSPDVVEKLQRVFDAMRICSSTYYRKTPSSIDPAGTAFLRMEAARKSNLKLVQSEVDRMVVELLDHRIDSVSSRVAFEALYSSDVTTVRGYADIVSADELALLLAQLEAVRLARAEELTKYMA